MKRLISLLLAVFIVSSLASCGTGKVPGETVDNTSSETDEPVETVLADPLPADLNFEGQTVMFYSNCYSAEFSPIFVEEQNGEILNDARFETEQYVEDRLGIEIVETLGSNSVDAFDADLKNLILSGDSTYDIVTNMDRFMFADTTSGMFHATSDLPYVNLDAEYWNPAATARFSVGNKIYYTLSSFNLYSYANTNAVYMNTEISDKLGIKDIYDTVRKGGWTYELMDQYASMAYMDLNGDSKADIGDQFGYYPATDKNTWINAVVAAGCFDEIMHKDKDDYFVYNISEKLVGVLESIYGFYYKTPYVFTSGGVSFSDNTTLFFESKLSGMSVFRDIKFDFSVLPIPKYDESQDSYYCRTYDTFFTMVPVTCDRTELCGAVLEALSWKAYTDLLPAYINDTLQVKLVRDDSSAEMIRLILDSRTISIAEAYMFSIYGNYHMHENYMKLTNASPMSYLDSIKEKTIAEIDKFNTYFRKVNND